MYLVRLEGQNVQTKDRARQVFLFTLVLHAVFLILRYAVTSRADVLSLSAYTHIAAFFILFVSFWVEQRMKARFFMLFTIPVGLLFWFMAVLAENHVQAAAAVRPPFWLWAHLGLLLGGVVSLILAFSGAVMYLLQSWQLKSKHVGSVFMRLPSLDVLDRLHFRSLSVGVILFSLGVLSGFLWAKETREMGDLVQDPKVTLSFLTCFMYWMVLGFRLSQVRRGKKIAAGTAIVFVLLLVTILSSYYAPTMLHKGS